MHTIYSSLSTHNIQIRYAGAGVYTSGMLLLDFVCQRFKCAEAGGPSRRNRAGGKNCGGYTQNMRYIALISR